jgi:hypothetical protein
MTRRVLLLTPPMTQLNTPYPATAYLKGFLAQHAEAAAIDVVQADPAIELFTALFCREGLRQVTDAARTGGVDTDSVRNLLANAERYAGTVDAVVTFLQGRDPSLALRIVGRTFLPEGPRFAPVLGDEGEETLGWAFGALGSADRAKHLASLYIDDLADAIKQGVDPRFELSRYGESLASSAPSFDPLRSALEGPPTVVDALLDRITTALMERHRPAVVGMTVPFPGNVYGAFRMARTIRALMPEVRIVLGGGYVNTELRGLTDPRVFDYVDYITLDDGERPLLALLEHLRDPTAPLLRTFVREGDAVVLRSDPSLHDVPLRDAGTPDYAGLPLGRYLSLLEMLNPMHRLWSDGRWNKLTIAHGCYWKKCSFCDVTLDYIARYDPASADILVDRIDAIVAQTGERSGDAAARPAPARAGPSAGGLGARSGRRRRAHERADAARGGARGELGGAAGCLGGVLCPDRRRMKISALLGRKRVVP